MADTIIAAKPPNDGRDWDCQCARCGSSTVFEHCHDCGGDGFVLEDEMGPEVYRCETCNGAGGWADCGSGVEWCGAHPQAGREQVQRGVVEWFVIGGGS